MEQLRVVTEGIGRKGRLEMPLGGRLTVIGGKERAILSQAYLFSHLSSVDALDKLCISITRYEFSLKSAMIGSLFNGSWDMDDDEKRRIADDIRDGSLDHAMTDWSHLLPGEDADRANRFLSEDLLRIGGEGLGEDDPRTGMDAMLGLMASDMLGPVAAGGPVELRVGPWGEPSDENSWTELHVDEDGRAGGRISLCPALLYFGPRSMAETVASDDTPYIRAESRNMMYVPKGDGKRLLSSRESLDGAEKRLRTVIGGIRRGMTGSVDWDSLHGRFRYYSRKGRRGDFHGLPAGESRFGAFLAFLDWFDFLGNEVWFFENAEKGLMPKEKELLSSFIAAASGVSGWRIIVTGDDPEFLSSVERKASETVPSSDIISYVIDSADDITLNGGKMGSSSGEDPKKAASEDGEAFVREPAVFYEMSTGIDMEPYYTESFMGAAYYLNRMTAIIEDKPGMEDEGVRASLGRAYAAMSTIMNGRLAPEGPFEWNGSASDFSRAWRLDDVRADIRERRSNRYMEISGIGDGFGFAPVKGGPDRRIWLMERMEDLLGEVWTLSRRLEESGVRFNANTMVYKSLDSFLYYMSDAWYITERGKVHRHIMKDVKDRIEYLYTYYGLKKVVRKLGL